MRPSQPLGLLKSFYAPTLSIGARWPTTPDEFGMQHGQHPHQDQFDLQSRPSKRPRIKIKQPTHPNPKQSGAARRLSPKLPTILDSYNHCPHPWRIALHRSYLQAKKNDYTPRTQMRDFIADILPPVLFRNIRSFLTYINYLVSPTKKLALRNLGLKNSKNMRDAFLLATGPSISNVDIAKLAGQDCYTVSNFFLHKDIQAISPKMHFFAPYHKPLVLENYVDWLKAADKALPPNTEICLGESTFEIVQKYNLFPKRLVHYLWLGYTQKATVDITKVTLTPQTGPLMIIPTLMYMGYRRIFLLGCDHNVLKDYGGDLRNFYPKASDMRVNATDRNSWAGIIESHRSSLNVFTQYNYYKSVAEKMNTELINLTTGSWLDFIKQDKIESILPSYHQGKDSQT